MPQIGWLEILAIVIIAILVLGPKEFPIALKKIGSYFGKLKNTLSSFQREVNSVTENIEKAVKDVKHGQARFKADQEGVIHGTFASVEMDKKQISENLDAFIDELKRLKPASSKGIYIKDIYLSTTMGPGYRIDVSQF